MDNVLIDTDVILDFFFDREPFAEFATDILNLCEENKIKGFTTPVIICNTYYLLRKTAKHDIVIEKIKQLLTIIDVLKIDKEVVLDSLNSNFKDFEDALQNYSAVKNGKISIVLTRNIKDYKKSELAVMTPETYLRGTASS
ncbi:PIN domain-containing protein [Gramella lutea]|uniref:PIN domain-containing protein n=1 Tax=Christiangramia lutea TaxID=1607951 RepID=A0A9X1V5M1_9FLAO|nr:PIN domain-containing protein [Christiangramia lutea]MCH4824674.1 PIN domain-containing protein [Christiangramia lutea]|tara:strand:+ start:355 stop:777 length:423 start_codon:yes stop_codon:yes gene_type:complete